MYVHVNNYNNGFTKTITICIDFDCIQLLKTTATTVTTSNAQRRQFAITTLTYLIVYFIRMYVCMYECMCM